MDASKPPNLVESSDVFSLSDRDLSDRLHFIEEIGFGNWGSVWLCKPKPPSASTSASHCFANIPEQKIAVKLVHRSKTATTSARVRSLWNEMKIVKSFKTDPHPAIIPFHSFIITPSYALITMSYIPTLVPVDVDEIKARDWFRFLLSGVEFLHKRGIVHNDIKPANILISQKNIPVLVDFGFAEKYDVKSPTAFHSNLSYGTPEYLSPERARGLPHDTRKSDIWSLGVTFFEILTGRTPFEHSDGEQFSSKEDLEKYWERTLRGKWVGEWMISKNMERMLRQMITPNADLRCYATQAMKDSYWSYRKDSNTHRRSASYTSSIVFAKNMANSMNSSSQLTDEDIPNTPPGLGPVRKPSKEDSQVPQLARAKPQPPVVSPKSGQPRRRALPVRELSPVASPPSSPFSVATGKENIREFNAIAAGSAAVARKPLGNRLNLPEPQLSPLQSLEHGKNKTRMLGGLTVRNGNIENQRTPDSNAREAEKVKKDPVKDRVRQWERERERIREMERLEEIERETDEATDERVKEKEPEVGNKYHVPMLLTPVVSPAASSFTTESSRSSRCLSITDSGLNVIKNNFRKSIDKTTSLYRSSTITQSTKKPSGLSIEHQTVMSRSPELSHPIEEDILFRNAPSTLASIRQAAHNERIAADARMDRMTIWMRNVEKVVEDARHAFEATSAHQLTVLPSLPVAPLSRSQSRTNRSSRLPLRDLAANEIFVHENEQSHSAMDFSSPTGAFTTVNDISSPPAPKDLCQLQVPDLPHTPRKRRATVSSYSPNKTMQLPTLEVTSASPSKRREKSKSHANLLQLHIAPVSLLEAELKKSEVPPSAHRLSEVLDGSLFIAPPLSPRPASSPREEDSDMQDMSMVQDSSSFDDLTSSPLHVEPYPARKPNAASAEIPDTPSQRKIEGVYDRFLMATSGVKRLGKGYQSDNAGPVPNANSKPDSHRLFHSTRQPMPPPVSSEDQRRTVSVDEFGVVASTMPLSSTTAGHTVLMDDGNTTVALVRRAIKAIVPNSKRLSRIV